MFAELIKLGADRVKIALNEALARRMATSLGTLDPAAREALLAKVFTDPKHLAAVKAQMGSLAGADLNSVLYENLRAVEDVSGRSNVRLKKKLRYDPKSDKPKTPRQYDPKATRSDLHRRINARGKLDSSPAGKIRDIYGGSGQYFPYQAKRYDTGNLDPKKARALYNQRQGEARQQRMEGGWGKVDPTNESRMKSPIPNAGAVKNELAARAKHEGGLGETGQQVERHLKGDFKGPDGKMLRPDQLPLGQRTYTRPANVKMPMGWGMKALLGAGALGLGYGAYKMLSGNKRRDEE